MSEELKAALEEHCESLNHPNWREEFEPLIDGLALMIHQQASDRRMEEFDHLARQLSELFEVVLGVPEQEEETTDGTR